MSDLLWIVTKRPRGKTTEWGVVQVTADIRTGLTPRMSSQLWLRCKSDAEMVQYLLNRPKRHPEADLPKYDTVPVYRGQGMVPREMQYAILKVVGSTDGGIWTLEGIAENIPSKYARSVVRRMVKNTMVGMVKRDWIVSTHLDDEEYWSLTNTGKTVLKNGSLKYG